MASRSYIHEALTVHSQPAFESERKGGRDLAPLHRLVLLNKSAGSDLNLYRLGGAAVARHG